MKKRKHSVGYFSSYDRGLHCLLQIWPQIRKEVPDATLDIAYGWGTYLAIRSEDQFYREVNQMLNDLKSEGVTEHGRLSHEELAKLMLKTQVWAYPTQFTEIHCITALKAQEARMWPVVTRVAALEETVKEGDFIDHAFIYRSEYAKSRFAKKVIEALEDNKQAKPVPGVGWNNVAKQWSEVFSGR